MPTRHGALVTAAVSRFFVAQYEGQGTATRSISAHVDFDVDDAMCVSAVRMLLSGECR